MATRSQRIAKSIISAILFSGLQLGQARTLVSRIFAAFAAFFVLYQLHLVKVRDDLFQRLRKETWHLDEEDYKSSFEGEEPLKPTSDMGFSGSVSPITSALLPHT